MSLLSPPLEAFLAIATHKTVHAAAKQLHITQTAVTQRIRGLEAKLNVSLFIRSRRGMVLTPEGEALLRYCNATQELEGEAMARISGAGKDSHVRITISGPTSMMRARILPQCFTVMEKFPFLLMSFDITDVENRAQLLRSGHSEFVIIQPEDLADEMEYKPLAPEQYVLVCTHKWRKRTLQDIIDNERIIDYEPSDNLTFRYLKHYRLFDQASNDRHFANRTDTLAMMLVAGFGYGLLTKEYSQPYVARNELIILNKNNIFEHEYVLAWYDRPEPARYFSALIAAIN